MFKDAQINTLYKRLKYKAGFFLNFTVLASKNIKYRYGIFYSVLNVLKTSNIQEQITLKLALTSAMAE
jgi:hypothetical protein